MVSPGKLASFGLAGMLSTCAAAAMDERVEDPLISSYSVLRENTKEGIVLPSMYIKERIENDYNGRLKW